LNCCAVAGNVSARSSPRPRNRLRARTVYLPRFRESCH
jgi:hypothetical protein